MKYLLAIFLLAGCNSGIQWGNNCSKEFVGKQYTSGWDLLECRSINTAYRGVRYEYIRVYPVAR